MDQEKQQQQWTYKYKKKKPGSKTDHRSILCVNIPVENPPTTAVAKLEPEPGQLKSDKVEKVLLHIINFFSLSVNTDTQQH